MIRGGLFTRDFLGEGIKETAAWAQVDAAAVATVRDGITARLADFVGRRTPSEQETEDDLIWPILGALGWQDHARQLNLSATGRADVPDGLLFLDPGRKAASLPLPPWQRYRNGACLVESKRWQRLLDREDRDPAGEAGVPSTQMLRYLRRADDITAGGLRMGILTNGRHWRLYRHATAGTAEAFFEIDLGKVLLPSSFPADLLDCEALGDMPEAAARDHALRLFLVFFGRSAFLPVDGLTVHEVALRDGRQWEERVTRTLSHTVFRDVYPSLAEAIVDADPQRDAALSAAYLESVRQGALILLYRLLFVLYAEDRNLLPDETGPYREYALTRLRFELAEKATSGALPASRMTGIWNRLDDIFRAIAEGDDHLGIPPYNGGLFDPATAPVLARLRLADQVLAPALLKLSHVEDGRGGLRYVNYRDLSVQQLGAVYEGILEHGLRPADPVKGETGRIAIAGDADARWETGSYYTPEELVTLVIERTVGPLVAERLAAFQARADALASDTRPVAARLADLQPLDPATALLDLKVLDPAMGSGHFLVTFVDWLADRVLAATLEAAVGVAWGEYVSPLAARISAVRADIERRAAEHRWPIRDGQLDDRHVVRRMILKRVVHGVDKNPMAVELAKVALWLHSFTVGAPLSFLDHHLRCGDSVLGAWAGPTVRMLQDRGALLRPGIIQQVEAAARLMEGIEASTDTDIAEVAASKAAFRALEDATGPVAAFFSLLTAERMMGIFAAAPKKAPPDPEALARAGKPERQVAKARADRIAFDRAAAFQVALDGTVADPLDVATGRASIAPPDAVRQMDLLPTEAPDQASLFPGLATGDARRVLADRLVAEARRIAADQRFLHWQAAFPNVWRDLTSDAPPGGFDAVIGNPPYVRQELLGAIKPALRPDADPDLAEPDETATADRRRERARRLLRPRAGFAAFDGVADLYVYFYEQGLRLLRPGGRLGYVVTNKWLRIGYAEALRGLLADAAWVEFVADFGHARHFFPDADVFPSVLVARRPPEREEGPEATTVCVIPRDAVPDKGLGMAVAAAAYPLPRAGFTRESWVLEPPAVMSVLDKMKRNGIPLADYVGTKPFYGIKTGFNEAFLIDQTTRDRVVADDPGCAGVIRPYLRGQDVERWWSQESGLHMIVMKSSGDHSWPWSDANGYPEAERIFQQSYPSLYRHLGEHEESLRRRCDQGRFWWELRSCSYYEKFSEPKILYQDLAWSSEFSYDDSGIFVNDLSFFLPVADFSLLAILNSPVVWYWLWNKAAHGKDEVLRLKGIYMEKLPIPSGSSEIINPETVRVIRDLEKLLQGYYSVLASWLRHEYGLDRPGKSLATPASLDADGFVAAVRDALPKKRRLTPAEIAHIRDAHASTVEPARRAAAEILRLERDLSDRVNAAYGLTPEDVRLMWETAPPRMPLDPAAELRRLRLPEAVP
jgi:hypothetical protein